MPFSTPSALRLSLTSGWFVILFLVSACQTSFQYDVKGRVAGFGDDDRTIIIEHEEVPGLMPAMTMSFKSREPIEEASLAVGDPLAFQLTVTRKGSWIDHLVLLPDTAIAQHPAGSDLLFPMGDEALPLLSIGDVLPDARLLNQDGVPFHLDDLRGQALVVTFIYTRCPIPDYCPLLSQKFQALQPLLRAAYGSSVLLLSISFDPGHDTPAVLTSYARRYTSTLDNWRFATGEVEEISRIAHALGVFYKSDDANMISHNLTTAVIDTAGKLRGQWRGNDWTVEQILASLEAVKPPLGPVTPKLLPGAK